MKNTILGTDPFTIIDDLYNLMRIVLYIIISLIVTDDALGQEPLRPIDSNDPKGLRLPAGVPRMVDTNGNVVWVDINFTTRRYQQAAIKLVLQEANRVAKELQLSENLPITESNIVGAFISPFGYNYTYKRIGTITTTNYCYYVSLDNKFCYLEGTHQEQDCRRYQDLYTWPMSRINTNEAYQLATQWLADVSVDVNALNRDCQVTVERDSGYTYAPPGKFVPVYYVAWGNLASVRVFTPAGKLLELRVEDPKYLLREPLIFTNLDSLFPGTGQVWILPPPRPGIPPDLN
jgi:hypothetical protein